MDFDFAQPEEDPWNTFSKPQKKKKKKKNKGPDEGEDLASGWTDEAQRQVGFDDFSVDPGLGARSTQPEAESRTLRRRVSFSDDPPESHTFSKTDVDAGAGVGPWPEELTSTSAKAEVPPDLKAAEELCWKCGKAFELWDSLFCRHCGCRRGSPAEPGMDAGASTAGFSQSSPIRPLERRFSFSLMDMATEQVGRAGLVGSPYLPGSEPIRESLETQKWNPLDGVKRHWWPTNDEFRQGQSGHMQSEGASPQVLSALRSGNIVEEVQKAEQRLQGLQRKISNIEGSLNRGMWPSGGRISVSMTQLAHDGGLGVSLQGLTIAGITDAETADRAGWAVGDHILQVNGVTILNDHQLSQELAKALSAHRAVMRPLHVEVWRPETKTETDLARASRPAAQAVHVTHGLQPQSARQPSTPSPPAQPSRPPSRPFAAAEPVAAPVAHQLWAGPKLLSPQPPQTPATYLAPAASASLKPSMSRRRAALC